jgi:cytochrome c oxidase accessory protein FixG
MSNATPIATGRPVATTPTGGTRAARAAVAPEPQEIHLYAKRETIYQREVQGPWQRLRAVVLFVLAGFYVILPWVTWSGRQAVLFDLPQRKFYLFGLTFWPQDFIFLSWLLIIAAFSLFFFTALAGRLWCGYACPQTVWTKFFMWIEWLTEGDRIQRMRLDRSPWTRGKLLRKAAKHTLWFGLALVVGITFVGYFVPIRDLVPRLPTFDVSWVEVFWLTVGTLVLYADAGWMREQVCIYVCPYARFQGAMFDTATLTIFYDAGRGEPRGRRARSADRAAVGMGDCVDCGFCVQVCPTGIDIRDGTQYECIGCAACIDACNEIMSEVGYPKGLVRYATEDGLAGRSASLLRPRLVAYGAVLAVMIGAFAYGLASRVPLKVDVLRDRARLYRYTSEGFIENAYTLKIMNMDQDAHVYRIAADAIPGLQLRAPAQVEVASGAIVDVPVSVSVAPEQIRQRSVPVVFTVEAAGRPAIAVREKSKFIAPAKVAG